MLRCPCFRNNCGSQAAARLVLLRGERRELRGMELDKIIRDTLTSFIRAHVPAADLSGMDEVFFSYITGVLEELGSPGATEESFDMEAFAEVMEAFVPGFAEINSGQVCDMMFVLSGQLSDARNKENACPKTPEEAPLGNPPATSELSPEEEANEAGRPRAPAVEAAAQEAGGELQDGVELLLEMFPACTVGQARRALTRALGDLEEAVQLLVEENVEPQACSVNPKDGPKLQGAPRKEDLKPFILQKYMMVDSEDDQKTHRPVAPKEAPKKLIRYIDNQIVSTKGERYKDMRKPETEEMKKTYINLKPARKYKFH
ncbi:CUE domain-containing protein 2 isoform X1 [Ornithorhynchus anatinus]|nr:CUE domain-containing protein 2 isoform X1 [Ornithorhynchus anatinus]